MAHVLVVDDEAQVRRLLRRLLEDAGHEVSEAAGGDEALRDGPADVVFCDVYMPGTDGLEVIRELRRELPAVRVVAASGGGIGCRVDVLRLARLMGAAVTLAKPFRTGEALAAVEHALAMPPAQQGPGQRTPL